jgi:formate hydrogenlyase subunit 3/multisubunit Na+/H+ antiporter MnhD subunit
MLTSISTLVLFGLSAPFFHKHEKFIVSVFFPIFAAASLVSFAAGFLAVSGGITEKMILQAGLPGLPFHLRLDPISGFFITVISLLSFCVSVYSVGYVKSFIGRESVANMAVFYPLFIAGMLLTLLADDAFIFLVGWEVMAMSSYFLVIFENKIGANRRAALLYVVMAHAGALAILMSFGVLAGFAGGFETFGGYTFDAMRSATIPPFWAGVAFLLAFLGFGAKAGIVPLHVWLPEAHPAAPSNVSALMSGAMLKTAIYGILRVSFDILHVSQLWWGELVLIAGLVSALLGVLYAIMENDLKRLLAYSSVENIGVILIGVGLSMIFFTFQKPLMSALAITAALYHVMNHAMFKGLLFMGAGSVLHSTHERNMENMGGLIHKMKWTAPLFLVGCLSISALPPFNGFVSEWLTFQAFLMSPALTSQGLNLLIPLGAALLALTAVLSASSFVKAFGISFLGKPRSENCATAEESPWSMLIGMSILAMTCLLLGVFPTAVIGWMSNVSTALAGETIAKSAGGMGWLWLTPVAAERASYSAPMLFLGIISVVVIVFLTLHARKNTIHRVKPWDCGYGGLTSKMQYSSYSFSMPSRVIFGFFFRIRERVKIDLARTRAPEFPAQIKYSLRIRDRLWGWLYKPVIDGVFKLGRHTARLQHGRIHVYLAYSFITVIFLLLFAL